MSYTPRSPYASPRHHGTVIVVSTLDAPVPITSAIHTIATFIAAGTGLRVGVIHHTPVRHASFTFRPAEGLLAACNGAAGRLLGVSPSRRAITHPPGVDSFAPRLTATLTPQDWRDIYQEARVSRGVLIVVNPIEAIYRDITLDFGEQIVIEECGRKLDYPEGYSNWKPLAVMLLNTMLAVRALYTPPCDAFGAEAIFGSPLG